MRLFRRSNADTTATPVEGLRAYVPTPQEVEDSVWQPLLDAELERLSHAVAHTVRHEASILERH